MLIQNINGAITFMREFRCNLSKSLWVQAFFVLWQFGHSLGVLKYQSFFCLGFQQCCFLDDLKIRLPDQDAYQLTVDSCTRRWNACYLHAHGQFNQSYFTSSCLFIQSGVRYCGRDSCRSKREASADATITPNVYTTQIHINETYNKVPTYLRPKQFLYLLIKCIK